MQEVPDMIQLSDEQLNNLDKEALVIIVSSLQDQLLALQSQLDHANAQLSDNNRQIELLTEQIRIMNQRFFGRRSESAVSDIDGQISLFDSFNEAEYMNQEPSKEPAITEVIIPSYHRKKAVGKRESDLSGLPARIIEHTLSDGELAVKFPDGYKELPAEVYKRLHIIPETFIVDEHHVHVYASKNNDGTILKAPRPKDLFRNSIANNIMNIKIYHFKKILDENTTQKIAASISDRHHCKSICNRLVSSSSINYAHLFKNLKQYLLPGTILKIESISSHNSKYIFAPNTYIHSPYQNNIDTDNWYNENCIYHTSSSGRHIKINVWHCYANFKFSGNINDKRDSKIILRNIIDYYYTDKKVRASLFGRINGIIGNLNSSQCTYSKQDFYNILKQKFFSRSDIEWITNHPDFDQFLFRKIEEIYQKKK